MEFNGKSIDDRTYHHSYENLIELEQERQDITIELIASENFPSQRVLDAAGSILTNKYAEGYSGKRYYGGCQFIDMIETKAISDACKLFHCKFANVQPHCGSSANQAVYRAFCKSEDTILGMDLGAGGHLTHGHKMSFSGQDYNIVSYGVTKEGILDYNDLEEKLYKYNPTMLIVGASSYSQIIDYERIYRILENYQKKTNNKVIYFVDMAHVAGLVAGGAHPSPLPWADVVTSTTHKTLRGPRGGLILWNNEEYTKKINSALFPGVQGGPLEHIIAAKGICFEEAMKSEFKDYANQIIKNANAFANKFKELGWKVISGGTQNHMFVLDVFHSIGITGKQAEEALDKINITVNKNQIPNDELPPLKSSGIRIGVPAMTTKGWKEIDFEMLACLIVSYLIDYKTNTLEEKELQKFKDIVSMYINRTIKYGD